MDRPAPDWRIIGCLISDPDAAMLVEEVQQEYVVRYGTRDETPLAVGYFEDPQGAFFVGYVGTEPVATGAWHRRVDVEFEGRRQAAEIKRMYVRPTARGRGLARAMLTHLEDTARAAGADVMILESGTEQPEALALYASVGYTTIPGFGFYKDAPVNRCMARFL